MAATAEFVFARRVGVDRFRDQFLAGAAFALNQNCGTAGRDLGYEVEDLEHDLALADDVGEVIALLESALELEVLLLGAMASDGGANVGQQLFVVPGLLNEVFRAGADRVHDIVHGAVGGNHDDRQIGMALLDLREQFEAALAGQSQVQQQQVEAVLIENLQPLFAVGGQGDGIALQGEQHFERLADGGLVVDDQNAGQATGES